MTLLQLVEEENVHLFPVGEERRGYDGKNYEPPGCVRHDVLSEPTLHEELLKCRSLYICELTRKKLLGKHREQ